MYYYFSNNFTKITLLEIFSRVCIFWWLNPLVSKPRSMTESNSHDAVVNLKSKTMNIKNKKSCREPSTKFFSLEECCKEIFFLARFLQDVLQKNASSCKTLKENLARSLQGTHFFSTRVITYMRPNGRLWTCFVTQNALKSKYKMQKVKIV